MLGAFKKAFSNAEKGKFEPAPAEPDTPGRRPRRSLVIRANILTIDYEEARRDILTALLASGLHPVPKTPS